ncbi:translation initiation factor IF-2 [Lysobacter soyae]|uniref:Translation initiation factor IF-2 n=1 Tax=Lysobacter soyae TaxID=2764185 RepID=A0ABX8WPM5_9GAMM|nr:translation initiation factor IF-2 [Lysobacter sp. CJ11]QYR52088.1 translation initiation factor IF-2 [Lysobacter sp. CJ11]
MSQNTTIRKLAELVNTPVEKLLVQLAEAGMPFDNADQEVTSAQKVKLLGFLRRTHGRAEAAGETEQAPKKITLSRRKVEEITVGGGKNKSTVDVVVRKKVLVRPTEAKAAAPVTDEQAEIQRKLEESRQRNREEQERLAEQDRLLREKIEADKLALEEAKRAAEAAAAQAALDVSTGRGTRNDDDAQGSSRQKPAAAKPSPAKKPTRDDRSTGAQNKKGTSRGDNGMGATPEDDDNAARFAGKMHLSAQDRARRGPAVRGKAKPHRPEQVRTGSGDHGFQRPTAPIIREIQIGDAITVSDLAQKLALKGGDVVKALFKMGVMATVNQSIDHDTAALVTEELGHKAMRATDNDAESDLLAHVEDDNGEAQTPRPPVVTIMGHVDHGKTSLLDYIRRTKVANGEAGGITQHIGAYHVETPKGVISFLDTPGHAAFTSMRARGAKLTDIVVLVVAADDGVMPQTQEAIQHARAAKVPLIVAINKIDKSDANPMNVKNELLTHEVVSEDFGGDTQMVEISAKTGQGIDDLLDAISLQSEVLELKAVATGRAQGIVIESTLDKGRGPVATVLVQRGVLEKGDYLVCGVQYGRVRALFDETGTNVTSAGPSIPVQLLGLSGVPDAGDDFVVVADERLAKDVAQQRDAKRRETRLVAQGGNRMEDIMAQMGEGASQQTLNLVVKADVHGTFQALREALTGLSNNQIRINVIGGGVGGITDSDAQLAATSKAAIIGFNVRADATAKRTIDTHGLDVRYFSIIYDVIDQVKQIASGVLGKEIREEIIGTAAVQQVFRHSKFGSIAGSVVIEGVIRRGKPVRVLRDSTVIFEGDLDSLRRFQENVDEVKQGTECGIGVKGYDQVRPGDQIECFERIEVQRTL